MHIIYASTLFVSFAILKYSTLSVLCKNIIYKTNLFNYLFIIIFLYYVFKLVCCRMYFSFFGCVFDILQIFVREERDAQGDCKVDLT